jgi:hypothetical protein
MKKQNNYLKKKKSIVKTASMYRYYGYVICALLLALPVIDGYFEWFQSKNSVQKGLTTSRRREEPYHWKEKDKYYYPSLEVKVKEIVNGKCDTVIKKPSVDMVASPDHDITILELQVAGDLIEWWRLMPSPLQMRVDPYLCESVYFKKYPIFNNTGCQLPDYMSGSAPRCQTTYLKWICDQSKLNIADVSRNGFVIPESVHSKSFMPPVPFLVLAKNSFVTLCGQIVSRCGIVHTTANCKSKGYKSQGIAFQKRCSFHISDKVS